MPRGNETTQRASLADSPALLCMSLREPSHSTYLRSFSPCCFDANSTRSHSKDAFVGRTDVKTALECEVACAAEPRCNYFSSVAFAPFWKEQACYLCSRCDNFYWRAAIRENLASTTTSWRFEREVAASGGTVHLKRPPLPPPSWIHPHAQGSSWHTCPVEFKAYAAYFNVEDRTRSYEARAREVRAAHGELPTIVAPTFVALDGRLTSICKVPRVASTLMSSILIHRFEGAVSIDRLSNSHKHNFSTFSKALEAERRIAFVRHPTAWIISGYAHLRLKGYLQAGRMPLQAFLQAPRRPLRNATLLEVLDDCEAAQRFTLSMRHEERMQWHHLLPPQQCRCGQQCGLGYDYYRVEEHDVTTVVGSLVHPRHLPTALDPNETVVHSQPYDASVWCNETCVDLLNEHTSKSRAALGYPTPLKYESLRKAQHANETAWRKCMDEHDAAWHGTAWKSCTSF